MVSHRHTDFSPFLPVNGYPDLNRLLWRCSPGPALWTGGQQLPCPWIIAKSGNDIAINLSHAGVMQTDQLPDLPTGFFFQNIQAQNQFFTGG
jgi:hypothetical protein